MFSDDINLFEDIAFSYVKMEKENTQGYITRLSSENKMVKVIENTKDLIKLLDNSFTSIEIKDKVRILKELLYKID